MAERILALHRLDLGTADQFARQRAADGEAAPRVTVVDPVLLTQAQSHGIADAQLLPLPDCDISLDATARGLAALRGLCRPVDEVLAPLVPEARGAAWCGHWLHFLHVTAFGFASIGHRLAEALAGARVHVLLPELAHRYASHSFVPGLMVSDALRRAGLPVQLYSMTLPDWPEPLLPDLAADADRPVDLLCHLPTCFSDHAHFADEVRASGRAALALPSQFFDVALDGVAAAPLRPAGELADRLDPALQRRIEDTLQALREVLRGPLEAVLPSPRYVQLQLDALIEGYRLNAQLFFALDARFGARPPATVLMSNHDAGVHGALYSFARRHRLRCVQVPHSKVFNQPVFSHGHEVLCLTHPLQGGAAQDLDGSSQPTAMLDLAESWQLAATPARPLATLGLVLNSVVSDSMCLVDLKAYLDGLRRLQAWCAGRGVALRVRCRPNASAISMVCAALRMELDDLVRDQSGAIGDFAAQCDLVVGYDVPTTGIMEVLRRGVPVVQALCRPLGPQEWRIVSAEVVPQQPTEAVLARLDGFVADPLALWTFRRDQLAAYLRGAAAARPLRHWL